jgi:large subunit ribosomal protein L19
VDHVNEQLLQSYDPEHLRKTLFSRRNPRRLKAGSVVSVSSYTDGTKTQSTVFSGVLLGIGRKGVDTSFTLRNIVNRTGVEMKFKVHSPLIKRIEVIKEANKKGLKDLKRAKVYYLRDKPGIMNQIATAVKQTKTAPAAKGTKA